MSLGGKLSPSSKQPAARHMCMRHRKDFAPKYILHGPGNSKNKNCIVMRFVFCTEYLTLFKGKKSALGLMKAKSKLKKILWFADAS